MKCVLAVRMLVIRENRARFQWDSGEGGERARCGEATSLSPAPLTARDHFQLSIMAFHIACPITCERICYCELGFGGEGRRRAFEEEARRLEAFCRDPWAVRRPATPLGAEGEGVARVLVPRIQAPAAAPPLEDETEEWPSAQAKRAALQRRAAAASVAAEDYVRKLEAGVLVSAEDAVGQAAIEITKEDQLSTTTKVICRICFSGENEGSEKAKRMLSCKLCGKKYHKGCVRTWADNRDLFHWDFWTCPSCRICEVCRRTGDPLKFMFCKRCDAAYHCYCLQPPHKNVSHGPYLCPKHTRCHSCMSTVHGSGHSTRWFLGYNFCDACGRLFTKEKYCPVCLKVYRDSESTPMVCCDVCQRWVHCSCDGISDEKYLQFQSDRNLYYKCAACRGDCYQIRDMDDAVQELWRRRDKADHDLVTNLRTSAGLPTHDSFYPDSLSDDEHSPIISKTDYGKTLKFSVKGLADKPPKGASEQGKKVSKKPVNKKPVVKKGELKDEEQLQNMDKSEAGSLESGSVEEKIKMSYSIPLPDVAISTKQLKFSFDSSKLVNNANKEAHAKSFQAEVGKNLEPYSKEVNVKHSGKHDPVKGTKLVIHLGGRSRNLANSPLSEASSCPKEQEKALSNGSEPSSRHKVNPIEDPKLNSCAGGNHFHGEVGTVADNNYQRAVVNADSKVIKDNSYDLQHNTTERKMVLDECQPPTTKKTIIFRRRRAAETPSETASLMHDKAPRVANPENASVGSQSGNRDTIDSYSNNSSLPKDSRPLLKLKFKNPHLEHQDQLSLQGEKSIVKGQRSKRKRPSALPDNIGGKASENHVSLLREDGMDETMDASWILQRLGKDAIGKRVEVQISSSTWQKGVVSDLVGGVTLSVNLDNGRSRTLELGKQGVRLIPQKQKRTKL